jgi:heptosyltransferase-2
MAEEVSRVLVVPPNWLGDAVMSLPALADVRRKFASAELIVAARRGVSELYRLVPFVNRRLTLDWTGQWWRRRHLRADADCLREAGIDLAVLFPNSFASAWLVHRAGVPERWGYAADVRKRLLTRTVARPKGERHQSDYYRHLVHELGCENGSLEPDVTVPEAAIEGARGRLLNHGWNGTKPLVVLAPGAAYGKAKQWIPAYVAELATRLVKDRGVTCVFVGSRGDVAAVRDIRRAIAPEAERGVIDLTGQTTLEMLAGVFRLAATCVSNDSGAMHVAAAVGAPVVATFGPTKETATSPLPRDRSRVEVLTHEVWCRPCMLRDCPIDHRCMAGISPDHVLAAIDRIATMEPPR